jgi:hypothetical protein
MHMDDTTWRVYLETAAPYAGWITTVATGECYDAFGYSGGNGRSLMLAEENLELTEGFPMSKIGIWRPNAGTYGGSYGRLRDIYWGPWRHYTLSTYPSDTRAWIKLGAFVMPWNGSEPVPVEY